MAGFMRNRTGVVFHLDQGLLNNAELGFVACTVDGGDLPVEKKVAPAPAPAPVAAGRVAPKKGNGKAKGA